MSIAATGKPKSDTHKENLRKANLGKSNHPNKGKTGVHPEELLAQWSESHKKSWTPERRAEASAIRTGKKQTEEHIKKVVESRMVNGYNHSDETRDLMKQRREEYWEKKRQDAAKKESSSGD